MTVKKPTYWIYAHPKGKPHDETKKIYFTSHAEAKRYVEKYTPGEKGVYHIYPVDQSGYTNARIRGHKGDNGRY